MEPGSSEYAAYGGKIEFYIAGSENGFSSAPPQATRPTEASAATQEQGEGVSPNESSGKEAATDSPASNLPPSTGWRAKTMEDTMPYGVPAPPFPPQAEYDKLVAPLIGLSSEHYSWIVGCGYVVPSENDGRDIDVEEAKNMDGDFLYGMCLQYDHSPLTKIGTIVSHYYDEANRALWIGAMLFKGTESQRRIAESIARKEVRGLSAGFIDVTLGRGPTRNNKMIEMSVVSEPHYKNCILIEAHAEGKETLEIPVASAGEPGTVPLSMAPYLNPCSLGDNPSNLWSVRSSGTEKQEGSMPLSTNKSFVESSSSNNKTNQNSASASSQEALKKRTHESITNDNTSEGNSSNSFSNKRLTKMASSSNGNTTNVNGTNATGPAGGGVAPMDISAGGSAASNEASKLRGLLASGQTMDSIALQAAMQKNGSSLGAPSGSRFSEMSREQQLEQNRAQLAQQFLATLGLGQHQQINQPSLNRGSVLDPNIVGNLPAELQVKAFLEELGVGNTEGSVLTPVLMEAYNMKMSSIEGYKNATKSDVSSIAQFLEDNGVFNDMQDDQARDFCNREFASPEKYKTLDCMKAFMSKISSESARASEAEKSLKASQESNELLRKEVETHKSALEDLKKQMELYKMVQSVHSPFSLGESRSQAAPQPISAHHGSGGQYSLDELFIRRGQNSNQQSQPQFNGSNPAMSMQQQQQQQQQHQHQHQQQQQQFQIPQNTSQGPSSHFSFEDATKAINPSNIMPGVDINRAHAFSQNMGGILSECQRHGDAGGQMLMELVNMNGYKSDPKRFEDWYKRDMRSAYGEGTPNGLNPIITDPSVSNCFINPVMSHIDRQQGITVAWT